MQQIAYTRYLNFVSLLLSALGSERKRQGFSLQETSEHDIIVHHDNQPVQKILHELASVHAIQTACDYHLNEYHGGISYE